MNEGIGWILRAGLSPSCSCCRSLTLSKIITIHASTSVSEFQGPGACEWTSTSSESVLVGNEEKNFSERQHILRRDQRIPRARIT